VDSSSEQERPCPRDLTSLSNSNLPPGGRYPMEKGIKSDAERELRSSSTCRSHELEPVRSIWSPQDICLHCDIPRPRSSIGVNFRREQPHLGVGTRKRKPGLGRHGLPVNRDVVDQSVESIEKPGSRPCIQLWAFVKQRSPKGKRETYANEGSMRT
jgi:hypothetical protein